MIWADSGIYEYSTRFPIFEATCFLQEWGKERVEEREIGEDFDDAISDEKEEDAILVEFLGMVLKDGHTYTSTTIYNLSAFLHPF